MIKLKATAFILLRSGRIERQGTNMKNTKKIDGCFKID
jgi:hypothetical protein